MPSNRLCSGNPTSHAAFRGEQGGSDEVGTLSNRCRPMSLIEQLLSDLGKVSALRAAGSLPSIISIAAE